MADIIEGATIRNPFSLRRHVRAVVKIPRTIMRGLLDISKSVTICAAILRLPKGMARGLEPCVIYLICTSRICGASQNRLEAHIGKTSNMFHPLSPNTGSRKDDARSEKAYFFRVNDRVSLELSESAATDPGDSSGLQKGLMLFDGDNSLGGEGVGFGVPAVEYPDQTLFSTTASIQSSGERLCKLFQIDALQRKTWKKKHLINNRAYDILQSSLANTYRTNKQTRRHLNYLIRLQSLLGIGLSHLRTESRGFVRIEHRLSGNEILIKVDSSGLINKNFRRLLVFNEQSAEFDMYEDDSGILREESIGVWEQIDSRQASFRNSKTNVTFSVDNIQGTELYRGRELLKPRMDWAGFCYSIPPSLEHFEYTVRIT